MSGSDPSVRRVREGAGSSADDDCPGRPFETILASPMPDAVEAIAVDDILDVVAVDQPARGVMVRMVDGTDVGAVLSNIVRLRRCIRAGHVYEADVLRIDGGAVTVLIRPI